MKNSFIPKIKKPLLFKYIFFSSKSMLVAFLNGELKPRRTIEVTGKVVQKPKAPTGNGTQDP